MLENIKMLLGLSDSSKDQKILYYINKYTISILEHCNLNELNASIESFIEDKVVGIMENKNSNDNTVKAINRGDTRIEYNVVAATNNTSNSILTVLDKEFLSQFRKLRFS